ncbi:MAG: hypothetical protein ACLR23_16010 [Clostridia bacterium]
MTVRDTSQKVWTSPLVGRRRSGHWIKFQVLDDEMFDLDHIDRAVRPIAGDDQVLALHDASFAVGFQLGGPSLAVFRLVEQAKGVPSRRQRQGAVLVVDLEVAFDRDAIDDEEGSYSTVMPCAVRRREDEGFGWRRRRWGHPGWRRGDGEFGP